MRTRLLGGSIKATIQSRNIFITIAFFAVYGMAPQPSFAQQPETVAECDEDGVPPIAEPVQLIYGDHTEGCLIDPATETDTFRFDGTTGDVIRINFLGQSGNFAPLLEIRDNANMLVDTANCVPPFNSICSFTTESVLAVSGTYFVSIVEQGANNIGAYTLQLERVFPEPGIERLNYDSTMDDDGLAIDDLSVSDSIDPGTDTDQFFFQGTAGTTVRLNVLGQTGNFAPSIAVRDPSGNLVLDGADDNAACVPPFNSICSFQVDLSPAATGTYSVLIVETGHNNPGAYQFSLWCVVGDCDNDGDTIADTRRANLRYGEPVSMKAVSPGVDGEFYEFMGTPGDEIRFTVLGQTGNFAPRIELRDPNGVLTAPSGGQCIPPFNSICSFTVDLMPQIMGKYTLLLDEIGINNPGSYQLSLDCVFSPGDLACENLPGRFPDDVPENYWAFRFIETLIDYRITNGCADNSYCPEDAITRAQMAVFIERGIRGGDYVPPPATGTVFPDVPIDYWAASWIEQFLLDGVTGGCGNGIYCPEDSVTRAQMAVFLLRAKFGADHEPPPPVGVFNDVPVDYWAASWIEQLFAEGITVGCDEGLYCPEDPVTRAQMAVFVVRAFELGE